MDKASRNESHLPDWLLDWIDRVPPGRALDVGAGEGEVTRWLVQRGYHVDALEPRADLADQLRRTTRGEKVSVVESELQTWDVPRAAYALVIAAAVLHFLPPNELRDAADRLGLALQPGGYLMAEVLTTDDPSLEIYQQSSVAPVAENTYPLQDRSGYIHYFAPGELKRLFNQLESLEFEESRRRTVDHDGWAYRSGALLVARQPEEETL